jgi:hypothetical protein
VELEDLRPLYSHPGPFASVYIDTERSDPQAAQAITLRWKELRRRLGADGADPATLDALEAAVGTDRGLPAPRAQALFACRGELLHAEELPAPPPADTARFGRLPHVLPLLTLRREHPPYLLVLVDRVGADLQVRSPQRAAETRSVNGATTPIRKVEPGGWSQPRYQRRAENTWDRNARGVAAEVERLGAEYRARLVVVSGDVRARALLLEHLGSPWRERTESLNSGGRAEGSHPERADAEALRIATEREAARRAELRERFVRNLASGGAVQGLDDTVDALRAGEVDVLLLAPDAPALDAWLWWGPAASDIAPEEKPLVEDLGVAEPHRDRAADVLIRSLVGLGGRVVVTSGEPPQPREGIGALLRTR